MLHRIAIVLLAATAAWAADSKALEVLAKAQQAAGGAEKLAAVKDFIATRKIEGVGGGLSGSQVYKVVLPSAMRQESTLPFGALIVSLVDGQGKMQSFQGSGPLPPPQLAQAKGELFRLRESLLLADRDPDKSVAYVGEEDVDGRPAQVLEVSSKNGGQKARLYTDSATGELFQIAYDSAGLQGASQSIRQRFSDFRAVDGIQVPFAIETYQDDKLLSKITVEKFLYNTGLRKSEL